MLEMLLVFVAGHWKLEIKINKKVYFLLLIILYHSDYL